MDGDASRLVNRYYAYGGIYTLAASIIWGINTLFLLDAGLSISEVFLANAAFSVGTTLFEIPTGVVADTIGRRVSFLLSVSVLAGTTLAYVALAETGAGFVPYAFVSVLMGLGFTFYSGAMEAWLVDGLRATGFDGPLDRIFARAQIFSGFAMLVGTVGGGLLGQIDLALPFLLRSTLLAALFMLAWSGMHDLGFQRRTLTAREVPRIAASIAVAGVTFGWQRRPMRILIIVSAVQMGFFAWAWYAWQPYFLELLESDAVWVAGLVAALLAISMMVGNGIVSIVTRWCGRRTTVFLWSAGVFSASMVGVGAASSFGLALTFLAISAVAFGVQSPVRQAYVHEIVPSEQRATVVSFDSMFMGAGGVVGQAGLGGLAERRSFSAGYIVGGLTTIIALPMFLRLRSMNDAADVFEGTHPSPTGACAATGLPAVAQVENELLVGLSTPRWAMIGEMATQTFEHSDAYGLVDIDDAPVAVGPLRCARKVLERTTTDLARHATYALAFHGIDGSGGAAALNFDRDADDPSPIDVFTKELAGWASTNHFVASTGLGFVDGELDGVLPPSSDWLDQLEATSARASLPGVYSIVVASNDEESTLTGPYMIPTIDHEPDLAAALTSGADAVFVRAGTGALDHEVLADVNVKYIVGLQPLTTTARGLATATKQGCVIIPDFISMAGPYIAATLGQTSKSDVLEHVTETVRTARNRLDDAGTDTFVRACELAEDHLRTWTTDLPFGRPLAP